MMSIYIGCLLFGGTLIGASLLGGHDHGVDAHGHDGPGGDHHGGDHHGHGPHALSAVLPFLSLRFWAFAIAFFGLSGAAFALAGLGAVAPFAAGAVGLGSGYASARVLQKLARSTVGLVAGADAHIGREAQLLLPVEKGQRGKLRLQVGGITTDFIAETEGTDRLGAGETVLIVGLRGHVALVERSPAALPPFSPEKKEDP